MPAVVEHRPHRVRHGAAPRRHPGHDRLGVGRGEEPDPQPDADDAVDTALERVRASAVTVFACPTYKGTYTGLLKLFLDRIPGGDGLAGVVAAPLMLGAGPDHALAPDLTLRPVLFTLGATCALPGLYLIDSA
ncbi:NAD(P)H-dependent oxidoreductase [Pseudonocardia nematodicida]|uniref:NAD(P)H-dependent oxidoreductase n=1 Tax=Pseudonocardia nematodicida TaxID=1206997 RepID=A0ABV1KGU0_9PSEU